MNTELNRQDAIKQERINKAVWSACDTFRGTVDPSIYKDYVLTMLFVKYLSDVWQDHYDQYKAEHGDFPPIIHELMKNERFVLPPDANFYALHEARHEPGNGERIDKALHAIAETHDVPAGIRKESETEFPDISDTLKRVGKFLD